MCVRRLGPGLENIRSVARSIRNKYYTVLPLLRPNEIFISKVGRCVWVWQISVQLREQDRTGTCNSHAFSIGGALIQFVHPIQDTFNLKNNKLGYSPDSMILALNLMVETRRNTYGRNTPHTALNTSYSVAQNLIHTIKIKPLICSQFAVIFIPSLLPKIFKL